MNLILNHLNFVFWGVGYLLVICNALQFADWVGLRFDAHIEQKIATGLENKPQSKLSQYKISLIEV
jgi:hypothetical protein